MKKHTKECSYSGEPADPVLTCDCNGVTPDSEDDAIEKIVDEWMTQSRSLTIPTQEQWLRTTLRSYGDMRAVDERERILAFLPPLRVARREDFGSDSAYENIAHINEIRNGTVEKIRLLITNNTK